jgi:hypothetical protein
MTGEPNNQNRRVLVIDDNRAIHQDFRKILQAKAGDGDFDQARATLFGDSPLSEALEWFDLDCTDQGPAALSMVQLARYESRPFVVAFVDMRMPPGWGTAWKPSKTPLGSGCGASGGHLHGLHGSFLGGHRSSTGT